MKAASVGFHQEPGWVCWTFHVFHQPHHMSGNDVPIHPSARIRGLQEVHGRLARFDIQEPAHNRSHIIGGQVFFPL